MMTGALELVSLIGIMSLATGIRPRHLGLGRRPVESRRSLRGVFGAVSAFLVLSRVHQIEHIVVLSACVGLLFIAMLTALAIRRRTRHLRHSFVRRGLSGHERLRRLR